MNCSKLLPARECFFRTSERLLLRGLLSRGITLTLFALAPLFNACGTDSKIEAVKPNKETSTEPFKPNAAASRVYISAALKKIDSAITNGEYRYAYNAILHIIQKEPGEPVVFDKVLAYSQTFFEQDDPDTEFYANDLMFRAEAMLPFQPLANLEQSLNMLEERLEAQLFALTSETMELTEIPEDLGASFAQEGLLKLVENDELSPDIRITVAQFIRNGITSEMPLRLLELEDDENERSKYLESQEALRARLDTIELQSMAQSYKEDEAVQVQEWISSSRELLKFLNRPIKDVTSFNDIVDVTGTMRDHLPKGNRILQDLLIFHKSGLFEHEEFSLAKRHFFALQRLLKVIRYNYNFSLALGWLQHLSENEFTTKDGIVRTSTTLDSKVQRVTERLAATPNARQKLVKGLYGSGSDIDYDMRGLGIAPILDALELAYQYTETMKETEQLKQAAAMYKLMLIMAIDIDFVDVYVHGKLEDFWQRQVGDLDEPGRIVAAKLRMARSFR